VTSDSQPTEITPPAAGPASDLPDFALDGIDSPPADEAAPAAPVVIIHYRGKRWPALLWPPALILTIAALGLVYRAKVYDWTGLAPVVRTPTAAPRPSEEPAPAEPPPLVIKVENDRPTAPAAAEVPAPPPEIVPEKPKAREVVGFTRPQDAAPPAIVEAPAAPPVRPPETKQAVEAIKQAAAEKRKDRAATLALAAHIDEIEKLRQIRLRAQHAAEDQKKLEEARRAALLERPTVNNEIRRALDQQGDRAGPQIKLIMVKHGVAQPQDRVLLGKLINQTSGRFDRRSRVQLLRSGGWSETIILEYLFEREYKNLHKRGGPRNEDDAYVRAAKQLLEVPLPLEAVRAAPSNGPIANDRARSAPPR
jgi:hypothetical protein